ncbi:hypothetical protein QCA50_020110 [Cerrena zonata]|uniref:Glutaredoxin n=1 Tax=Cerrena zonata TaxID=2478898 RepID=A0AAW0F859_9APHY
MSVTEIESEAQFTELTSKDPAKLIALYFHTPWAGPCQTMNSIFKTLAQANPTTLFLSINADDLSEISELFEVKLSGADPKEFIAALNQFSDKPSSTTGNTDASTTAAASSSTSTSTSIPPAASSEESPEALEDRLKKLTSAAPVMLFMKGSPSSPQCGFSRQLVAILREHQVRFGFFDILKDDSVRQGLKNFSDWPTFPQLYINGEFQGGLDIIKESIEEDTEFFDNAIKNTA